MNINKLHEIIKNNVANKDMLNWIFHTSYRFRFNPIVDFSLNQLNDEEFELNFVLDNYFENTNQSVKFKTFCRDFKDKFLGITLEQLQKDLLSGVVSYVFIDENDENLVKWHRLAEINENLFKKYGFEKGRTEKFHSNPNEENLSRSEDIISYVAGGIAWTLTDGINVNEKNNDYLETRSNVLNYIISSVDEKRLEGKKIVVEERIDGVENTYDHSIEEDRTATYSTTFVYAIGKNQELFESYAKTGPYCSNWSLALNHRSLFEPKYIFSTDRFDSLLPKNDEEIKYNDENFYKFDFSKFEIVLFATRNEIFDFNDEEIKFFMDVAEFKFKLGDFMSSIASKNRIAQRRTKNNLEIFKDEEYILDCLDVFMEWNKLVEDVMELVQNEDVNKIADAVEELEDYLVETDGYVLAQSDKFFEDNYKHRRYLIAEKLVEMMLGNVEIDENSKKLALIYVTNYGLILDIIENQYKDIKLGE